MLCLNYESIYYVMTQILKLSCVSFSYVSISYVLAVRVGQGHLFPGLLLLIICILGQCAQPSYFGDTSYFIKGFFFSRLSGMFLSLAVKIVYFFQIF